MTYIPDNKLTAKVHGVVALEGLDGTGKTSIGEKLAEYLNATFCHTPHTDYNSLRKELDGRQSIDSLLFYLSAVAYDIENWRNSGSQLLIIDRYWISSLAYYCLKAQLSDEVSDIQIKRFYEWINQILPEPSIIIHLNCNREIRLNRIKQRSVERFGDNTSLEYEKCYISLLNKILAYSKSDLIHFDTSNYTSDTAAKFLAPKIREIQETSSLPKLIFLHGAPAAGKTTFAKELIKWLSVYFIKTVHIDDKLELIKYCETYGVENTDFKRTENGEIGEITPEFLSKRVVVFGELIKKAGLYADVIIAEYSTLDYENDLSCIKNIQPKLFDTARHILLTVDEDTALQRNEARKDGSGINRAVPIEYLKNYFKTKEVNEKCINEEVCECNNSAKEDIIKWILYS
jgi:dTMP kinase